MAFPSVNSFCIDVESVAEERARSFEGLALFVLPVNLPGLAAKLDHLSRSQLKRDPGFILEKVLT